MPYAARFMLLSLKRHYAKTLRSSLDQANTTYFRCLYARLMEYISKKTRHVQQKSLSRRDFSRK